LFNTSPKQKLNKFTVEVRDLSENYVQMLSKDYKKPLKYIIKITDANKSDYCFSTQDFKETIKKNFDEINNIMNDKLNNHKFTRNKTISTHIREGLDKGLTKVSSTAIAAKVGVGQGLGIASRAVSSGVGNAINIIRGRRNQPPDQPGSTVETPEI